jgi:hypothetical protein
LGIAWEQRWQAVVLRADLAVAIANWIYIWLFWPLLAVVLVWLFQSHRDRYPLYRDAILISGALGLIVFLLFPVAPPRLLADAGYVDTVGGRSLVYRLLLPHSLANLYAAMPSLHAGWVLVAGVAVARHASAAGWRLFAVALPILMALSIVGTANHYLLDGVVGWTFAVMGLVLAGGLGAVRARAAMSARPVDIDIEGLDAVARASGAGG